MVLKLELLGASWSLKPSIISLVDIVDSLDPLIGPGTEPPILVLDPDKIPSPTASNDGCQTRTPGGRTAWRTAAGLGEYSLPHGSGTHEVAVSSG